MSRVNLECDRHNEYLMYYYNPRDRSTGPLYMRSDVEILFTHMPMAMAVLSASPSIDLGVKYGDGNNSRVISTQMVDNKTVFAALARERGHPIRYDATRRLTIVDILGVPETCSLCNRCSTHFTMRG